MKTSQLPPLADAALRCKVQRNILQIKIGVAVLAFADEERRNNELPEGSPKYRVINPTGFAEDVARELNREDEIGATMLTDLLDKAMDRAIENGSAWVEEVKP